MYHKCTFQKACSKMHSYPVSPRILGQHTERSYRICRTRPMVLSQERIFSPLAKGIHRNTIEKEESIHLQAARMQDAEEWHLGACICLLPERENFWELFSRFFTQSTRTLRRILETLTNNPTRSTDKCTEIIPITAGIPRPCRAPWCAPYIGSIWPTSDVPTVKR